MPLVLAQNQADDPEVPATLGRFVELAPDSSAAPGVRALLEGG